MSDTQATDATVIMVTAEQVQNHNEFISLVVELVHADTDLAKTMVRASQELLRLKSPHAKSIILESNQAVQRGGKAKERITALAEKMGL